MNINYDKVASQACSIIELSGLDFSFSMEDLHLLIKKNARDHNMGAIMTKWLFKHDFFTEIERKFKKIILDLPSKDYSNLNSSNPRFNNLTAHCNHDKRLDLELSSIWGQIYGNGAYQVSHTHLPSHWSFVMFVNCPQNCSPVIFGEEDLEIYPKSGQGVLFPAWIRHYVPKNRAPERSVVSGNFYYKKLEIPHG